MDRNLDLLQDGALKFTDFAPLSPTPVKTGSPQLCWLIPVMAFSIMVGLSLDYDVFLVSRIVEFRVSTPPHGTVPACDCCEM